MPSDADYSAAKQELANRLLGARLSMLRARQSTGRAMPLLAMTVSSAIENAGANVHAVGIGLKVSDGKLTGEKCVRVHVAQKIATSLLGQNQIPKEIDGVPTDVIESMPATILPRRAVAGKKRRAKTPQILAAAAAPTDLRARYRPPFQGLSIGHFEITAGTIACFCRSTKAGDDPEVTYVLSNNHVLANVNKGKPGDDIYQQGPIDGGQAPDTIAKLERFIMLNLSGLPLNRVDAAIGRLVDGLNPIGAVNSIGIIAGTAAATDRMKVRKTGRTTGYTEGIVTDLDYQALVGMNHEDASIQATFDGQIRIEPVAPFQAIGLGGDSGSLVMDQTSQVAVGLYFAGPPGGEYGVANPIADVVRELEITIG
jgi:hypothetical protein